MIFKTIPKQVVNLGLVSFFNDVASELLYPVMPIFLTQVLGAPVYIVGIIEGVAEGSASIFKTLFGYWSDKLGRRKIFVVGGYFSSACAKVIIAFAYSWPIVFLGRFTDRFGKGVRTGARDALLLEATSDHNRGLIFGFHRSMDSAGAVLGPLIGFFLLYLFNENIRLILYIAAIPSLFALIFLVFIKDSQRKLKEAKLKLSLSLKGLPSQFKFFLLVMAIFSLGNSSDTFLILRAKDLGLTLSLTILAYVLFNITYTLISTPAGHLSDRIGTKKVFLAGILIYAAVYLAFAFVGNKALIWPLFAIYGFYIALTDGISKALVGSFIKSDIAGTAYGVLQTTISIFTLLASVIGGFLWSAVSPEATFLFGAVCAISAFFLFLFKKTSDDVNA